jgi:membrane fusion protein (multidrug efflux system)
MADQTKYDTATQVAHEAPPISSSGQGLARRPAEQHEAQSPASHTAARVLIVAVVLALLVGGYFLWRYMGTYESTDDAQVDGHLNELSTRVAGYVTEVDVTDNQQVEKGQRLVQIDPRDYQVAVERATADLANAEAAAQASPLTVPVQDVNSTTQECGSSRLNAFSQKMRAW